MPTEITALEERIGYTFRDRSIGLRALTHSSYANEHKLGRGEDYERLEFLGDAVLEMVTSRYLYDHFPDMREGEMTRFRASLVCEEALFACQRPIGISAFLRLGKGEESQGGRDNASILADVMEALIGAILLDSGVEDATAFIHRFILNDVGDRMKITDKKTTLQEMVQGKGIGRITYRLVRTDGPEHDKTFTSAVFLDERCLGEGSGKNKKSAEQAAAEQAIRALEEEQ